MKTRLDIILETVAAILSEEDRPSQNKDKPKYRYGSVSGFEGMVKDHMKDNPGMSRERAEREVRAHEKGRRKKKK